MRATARPGGWAALVCCVAIVAGCGSEAGAPQESTRTTGSTQSTARATDTGLSTTSVAEPATSAAESTTSAAVATTALPETTAGPATSHTAVPTTSAAPTTSTTPLQPALRTEFLRVDVPPRAFPIEGLEPCAPELCPSIAASESGELVAYDSQRNTFLIGNPPTRVVPLESALAGRDGYLVHVGPGDVAYLLVDIPSNSDPVGELVAVAVHGGREGEIVGRSEAGIDISGDTDFAPTRAGLVAVGCCGGDRIRPAPDAPIAIGWVDSSGAAATDEAPQLRVELGDETITVVRSDGLDERRWAISAAMIGSIRGMPDVWPTEDGGAALRNFDWATGGAPFFVLKPSGSVELVDTRDLMISAVLPFGGVIGYDGERYVTWQPATFAEPADAMDDLRDRLGDPTLAAADPDALIERVVSYLAPDPAGVDDGCEVPDTARVIERSGSDPVLVTIEHRFSCDDAGGGANYELTIGSAVDGASWHIRAATRRILCLRGTVPEGCV